MGMIGGQIEESKHELTKYRRRRASRGRAEHADDRRRPPDTDLRILRLTQHSTINTRSSASFSRRIFPSRRARSFEGQPPLLREHRLYRRTGCCASTALMPRSSSTRRIRILTGPRPEGLLGAAAP
jgi:hypothetical protein